MMTNNSLKLIILLIVIFLLSSCQNEDLINQDDLDIVKTDSETIDNQQNNQLDSKDILSDNENAEFYDAKDDDNSQSSISEVENNNKTKNCLKVTYAGGLNLRELPDINSNKIILMPYNSEIDIIDSEKVEDEIDEIEGNWIKVKYQNKVGWAFDAYLDSIIDFDNIKTGDIINGFEVQVLQDGKIVNLKNKISLTGELLMNDNYATFIPDRKYLNMLPKINTGNEFFYFHLVNFREIFEEKNLSCNTKNVYVEIDEYSIGSIIKGDKLIPKYRAEVLEIKEIEEEVTINYNGKSIEGCYITEELQVKDIICGLQIVYITVNNDKYEPQYPYYTGSVGFRGETTLKVNYNFIEDDYFGFTGYSFSIMQEDCNKIPHFKGQDTPVFQISKIDEEMKLKLGKKGKGIIKIKNFNNYWIPKEKTSTAEIAEIISVDNKEDF